MASLTVPTMMSPMPAYRRDEPPRTRMHRISLAPVLSATRSRDSCWITACLLTFPQDASCGWVHCPAKPVLALPGGSPGGGAPRPSLGLLEDLDEPPALG